MSRLRPGSIAACALVLAAGCAPCIPNIEDSAEYADAARRNGAAVGRAFDDVLSRSGGQLVTTWFTLRAPVISAQACQDAGDPALTVTGWTEPLEVSCLAWHVLGESYSTALTAGGRRLHLVHASKIVLEIPDRPYQIVERRPAYTTTELTECCGPERELVPDAGTTSPDPPAFEEVPVIVLEDRGFPTTSEMTYSAILIDTTNGCDSKTKHYYPR